MKKYSLLAFSALLFVACSDETTVFSDSSEGLTTEQNTSVLDNSITYEDAGVLVLSDDNTLSSLTGKDGDNAEAGDYPLTLVARVNAPSYSGGENLGASHVDIDGDYAYVSYNTVEDGYAGAVDIIFVGDPTSPRVTSRLYFSNGDINAIAYDNNSVYIVGGIDAEKSARATANSYLIRIPVDNGRMSVRSGVLFAFQEGFNATDVQVTSDAILVTSGKDGYLRSYRKSDFEVQKEAAFPDLRSITRFEDQLAILDGSKGVSFLNSNFETTSEISISSDFGDFAKRTIAVSSESVIVSEGAKGAGVYNKSTGALKKYLPILISPDGVASSNIVTNAVAINEKVILMANGGAGLSLSEDQGNDTEMVGVLDLNGSVNFVASKGDYIFAASGKAGLQIVKLNRPTTTLVNRCADLLAYNGSANLQVNANDDFAYRGAKQLNKITVNGKLLLCGSWTVNNETTLNENGLLEINGNFVVGRNNKRKDVVVGKNATLRIEGDLYVYGDLILEDGASLEFIGDSSIANIFGSVQLASTASVTGTFDDVQQKF